MAPPSRTVLLSGMSAHVTEDTIRGLLEGYGELDVRLLHGWASGGIGASGALGGCHVTFESVEHAQAFFEVSIGDVVVQGMPVTLSYLPWRLRDEHDRRGRDDGDDQASRGAR